MKITPQEAHKILKAGYPSLEELERFPFGEYLIRLWKRDDSDGADYRKHGPKVLESMNILLGNEPGKLLKSGDSEGKTIIGKMKWKICELFDDFEDDAGIFFRAAALYHDIGKYIIKERHPTVGWYTMEYLNPKEKSDLRSLLGDREDYLQLLLIMIRDHDEFGVLSTGEASFPILLRAMQSLGNNADDQKRIISGLMWLNLADIAGTPGITLTNRDLKKLYTDWQRLIEAIEECQGSGERIDDYLIREASKEDLVVERITRLLLEASRNAPIRSKELREDMTDAQVRAKVRNAIRTVYPTDNPNRSFSTELAHICKLDYGKRFFASLVEYYEGGPVSGESMSRTLPKWSDHYIDTDDLIYSILAILRRLTSTYSSMIRSESGQGSLIGVEMKDLTPRNAPEKTAQIIELLRKSHYPGLSWMMSDCLAWYF